MFSTIFGQVCWYGILVLVTGSLILDARSAVRESAEKKEESANKHQFA